MLCKDCVWHVCSDEPAPDWPRILQADKDARGKSKLNESLEVKQEIDDMDIDEQASYMILLNRSLAVRLTCCPVKCMCSVSSLERRIYMIPCRLKVANHMRVLGQD